MGRARNPNRDLAYKMYQSAKGNIKLKDIAKQLGVADTQIRKWKSQDQWDSDKKRNVTKNKGTLLNKKVTPETERIVELVSDNEKLTDNQRLFCLYYIQSFNATQSYIKAYNADFKTANVNGPRLLVNARVKEQIAVLKKELATEIAVSVQDVINEYTKQAFTDIGDYVAFGMWREEATEKVKDEELLEDDDGSQHIYESEGKKKLFDADGNPVYWYHNYVYFKDQDKVDTSLIKSVKMGKDGPVIELYDKQKAMDSLMKYFKEDKGTDIEEKLGNFLDKLGSSVKEDK